MCGPDLLARVEVGDGARHAQDAVVAASGQAQPLKRAAHELLARLVERAVLPDHRRRHIGVAAHARPLEALLLDGACGVDPRADHGRGLRLFPAAHGVVFDGGNGDVHVDPVKQRAGDAVQVALHLLFRAGAAPVGVPVPPAAAGVHGADEQKAARQRQTSRSARDRHDAVLERLAQRLHGGLVEFRQLVEKQHTVVREGDLSRPRNRPAAREGDGGGRVVRAAEGALRHERVFRVGQPRDGVDLRRLQRLLLRHVRQDRRQPPREHRLARAGRADEQHVVPARGGDLKRPFDVLLPHDVGEVGTGAAVRLRRRPRRGGRDRLLAREVAHQLKDVFNRVDREPTRERRLGGVLRRDIEGLQTQPPRAQRHRQHARHRAQRPRKAQLPEKGRVLRQVPELLGRRQDPQQDRQVVERALLALAGGGEVHGDAADREAGAAGLDGGADALARFAHGGIGQADHIKRGEPAGEKTLHRHLAAADAGQAQRADCHHHR